MDFVSFSHHLRWQNKKYIILSQEGDCLVKYAYVVEQWAAITHTALR